VKIDTSISQSIELEVPGYFLTTFEENDVESLQEILNLEAVNNNLVKVPKP
jgi:hypothetical protein